jgi:aromatic ring-opening dioxygenase catalytic subunit (LigB family)
MSPHHYEDVFTVSSGNYCFIWFLLDFLRPLGSRPATMYDFDDDTKPEPLEKLCKLTYPCPGAPELASRVADLIRGCGFPCREDAERGLDHGIWTCLFLLFPAADIPVVSLSVRRDLDVEAHIRVGRALSNLRGENILLLGSGEVVHNVPLMGARSSSPQPWCLSFECWLEALMGSEAGRDRDVAFTTFRSAPGADIAHPPSSPGEHLMPWFFAFGAGGSQARGTCVSREYLGSLPMSAYAFEEL